MTERTTAILLTAMVWVGPAAAPALAQAVAADATPASISEAAWIAGCWRMDDGRRVMDEHWMAPEGSAMLGMNRALRDGEFKGYELLILQPRDGRLIYEAHPSGQRPTEFPSTHVSDTLLVFENPFHDFPQKLVYDRRSADSIMVGVFAGVDDAAPAFDIALARVGCTGSPAFIPRPETALELRGAVNFITAYPALAGQGVANAVIEIPAGTSEKWEVIEPGSTMAWEIEDGAPRVIEYLAYPANYGMIPRTMLPTEMGGDGDPLDVVVLGPALPRGSVVSVRPVGVLRLLDDGERDDKIIAVQTEGPLSHVTTFADLETGYPGISDIIRIWFTGYKGTVSLETTGYGDETEALAVIREASAMFEAEAARVNTEHEGGAGH